MTKAATKVTSVNLGTKRSCPKCASKFYDFAKAEIQCPKCGTEVDPNAELQAFKAPAEKKAKKIIAQDDEEVVVTPSDAFESVDDLGDEDESLDGLATGDDGDEEDA